LVIVVLVLLWIVVLGPSLIRRRHEARSQTAVGRFHRGLRVLRRVGRPSVPAAHSLDRPSAVTPLVAGRRPRPITVAARPSWLVEQEGAAVAWAGLLEREPVGFVAPALDLEPSDVRAALREREGSRGGRSRHRTATPAERRRLTLRRLLLIVVGASVLGAIPALRVLWDVAFIAAGALVLYVAALAVLARQRRRRLALRRRVVALDPVARARRSGAEEAWVGRDGSGRMVEEELERELAEVAGR
jgi:hypothetical protein